jgi:pimeloyl-ACP methyl ester carboxylesterase
MVNSGMCGLQRGLRVGLNLLPAGVEVHGLPPVGHMPHLEAASDVNAIIAAHLQRAAGRAGS